MPLLPDQIRRAILAHAANCAPDECCGLLAIDGEGGLRFAYPLTNADPSPVSYTIDPDEQFHAMSHAETMGWQIGGAFHSHPGGTAMPSMIDIQTALEPDWMYLIASPDEIRGFWIRDGGIEELSLG
ncbi:MAG TPA: M67 family metallopeptidase [Acidimicrobiia bacterium]|nr:M67 family metallopeptidase [Acidimicrobiia bacterium]HEX5671998.1 M67 family metallopeptidase [Acidimicrobiia bacterium]